MIKHLLTLTLFSLALHGFSQTNLKTIIAGQNGTTKHFITLTQSEQLPFNAVQACKILGLDAQSSLVLKSIEKDKLGFVHYRFYQTWKSIPVNRSMYIINTKDGKIVSMSGSIITDFAPGIAEKNTVKIDAKQAILNALNQAGATKYIWQDKTNEALLREQLKNSSASYYPVAEKCWFYAGDQVDPKNLKLAYRVDVFAEEPYSRAYYFIDAATGKVLGHEDRIETSDITGAANTLYSGTQTIHSDQTGTNAYRLRDYSKGNGIVTLKAGSKVDYTNNSADWNLSLPDQNALDAHWGVEMTYDYYKANFNRNSIDDSGYALYSYVNNGGVLYKDNAGWNGTAMIYGKRLGSQQGVTGIDVTGHELTHGVTQYTSALVYQNESGAMNESMSDIMGKSVQFWAKPTDIDWRLSNDMNWFTRDMSNPNAYQQPDTYNGTYWQTGSGDNGGVHTNSGVGNFMFYLLVTGGSGTNDIGNAYDVQGIGLTEADQILYRSETVYLTSNAQYTDWRTACINAATDLYGASSNEVQQVENAWYAVGVSEGSITYCASAGLSTASEYINRIIFNTIDNTSGNNGGYGDYTSQITDVSAGTTYTIQLQAGFTGAVRQEGWTVFIDYNGDGNFTDAGEKVVSANIKKNTLVSRSFTMNAGGKNGFVRMRVSMHYNTNITDPCAAIDQGEVEDYTLNMLPDAGTDPDGLLFSKASVSPNPVNAAIAHLNYTLAKTGNISFTLIDANGVSFGNYKAGLQNKGVNSYTINNLPALRNGYYYVVVKQDEAIIGKLTILIAH